MPSGRCGRAAGATRRRQAPGCALTTSCPDAVICSTARRARQTWLHVSDDLGDGIEVSNDPRLYDASAEQLLDVIRQTRPEVGTLMYVGHNPAAQQLAAALTGQRQEFPSAAIAVIELSGRLAERRARRGEAGRIVGAGCRILTRQRGPAPGRSGWRDWGAGLPYDGSTDASSAPGCHTTAVRTPVARLPCHSRPVSSHPRPRRAPAATDRALTGGPRPAAAALGRWRRPAPRPPHRRPPPRRCEIPSR